MADQPTRQPIHQARYPISEIIEATRTSRRELTRVAQKVKAAIDASRATLARSKELLAKADAALLRR